MMIIFANNQNITLYFFIIYFHYIRQNKSRSKETILDYQYKKIYISTPHFSLLFTASSILNFFPRASLYWRFREPVQTLTKCILDWAEFFVSHSLCNSHSSVFLVWLTWCYLSILWATVINYVTVVRPGRDLFWYVILPRAVN